MELDITTRNLYDMYMLIHGAYKPLTAFMDRHCYKRSLRPIDGTKNTADVPIYVPIFLESAVPFEIGGQVSVYYTHEGSRVHIADITIRDCYKVDRVADAKVHFGTSDIAHPGVQLMHDLAAKPWNISCQVDPTYECLPISGPALVTTYIIDRIVRGEIAHSSNDVAAATAIMNPQEFRASINKKYGEFTLQGRIYDNVDEVPLESIRANVVGLQTRNPLHVAHFALLKTAAEMAACLNSDKSSRQYQETATLTIPVVSAVLGSVSPDDVPAEVRAATYLAEPIASNFELLLVPYNMWNAGPREVSLHMLVRRNYGFNAMIIGRDHAGMGSFYGPEEAQVSAATIAKLFPDTFRHLRLFYFDDVKCISTRAAQTSPTAQQVVDFDPYLSMLYGAKSRYEYIISAKSSPTSTDKASAGTHYKLTFGRACRAKEISGEEVAKSSVLAIAPISGTELRSMLARGESPPEWFSFPLTVAILQKYYSSRK